MTNLLDRFSDSELGFSDFEFVFSDSELGFSDFERKRQHAICNYIFTYVTKVTFVTQVNCHPGEQCHPGDKAAGSFFRFRA